ncbi:hypothetical protein EDC04DRAFT_1790055 [Pisolithus marmoratus]|nr:hypothetical protein EDC04DRAFT_1790055 [Pisolithus marmoratus]
MALQISWGWVRHFSCFLILLTLHAPLYHLPELHRILPSGSSPMQCCPPTSYCTWHLTHAILHQIIRFFHT